jgi:hypothetical protein
MSSTRPGVTIVHRVMRMNSTQNACQRNQVYNIVLYGTLHTSCVVDM